MKKNIVIIVLVVGVIAALSWGYTESQYRETYRTYLENSYQDDFQTVLASIKNIETLLSKAMVSGSKEYLSEILSDVWNQADIAQNNIGKLPISHTSIRETLQFINQLGDFSYTMNRIEVQGGEISQEQWADLEKLQKNCRYLLEELQSLNQEMEEGGVKFGDLRKEGEKYFDQASENLITERFTSVEKEMTEYPKLIYDGPFSDHIKDIEPKWIKGEEITEEEGKQIALDFINSKGASVTNSYESKEATIPKYSYDIKLSQRDETAYVEITRVGGHVLLVMKTRNPSEQKMTMEEAKEKADEFLKEKGYKNLKNTYYEKYQGAGVFNYAYFQDDVVIYPDLIKVQVALDDGEILGLEAQGFHMSHTEREIPDPKLSLEEARERVSIRLDITHERLAIIPTEFKTEVFCFEFKGVYKGEWYIIYIDAMTGREQQILKIIKANESVLTL